LFDLREEIGMSPYAMAQRAIAELKSSVHELLRQATPSGLTNAEIGRSLGIYTGHVGHEGHISRTLLAIMVAEGVVEQEPESKRWSLRSLGPGSHAEGDVQTNPESFLMATIVTASRKSKK
jgi:hypothetical protein